MSTSYALLLMLTATSFTVGWRARTPYASVARPAAAEVCSSRITCGCVRFTMRGWSARGGACGFEDLLEPVRQREQRLHLPRGGEDGGQSANAAALVSGLVSCRTLAIP